MRRLHAILAGIVFALTASFGLTSSDQSLELRAQLAGAPTQVYSAAELFRDLVAASVEPHAKRWDIPAPTGLRPCCALGHNLGVAIGPVPVPVVRLDNILPPNLFGRHRYNSNLIRLAVHPRNGVGLREQNGLLYTCGGGIVDTAHIRDYADLTVYLYSLLEPRLATAQTIELPEQAGRRLLHLRKIEAPALTGERRRELALALAGWISFQLSIWHEAASWYGWSSLPMFPETVSAFSPEDLYTNMLGIRLAFELIGARRVRSQTDYESAMDEAMPRLLARLGAMPASLSRSVISAIDGQWWTSSQRLPHRELLQLRSFETGPVLAPLRVPRRRLQQKLGTYEADYCAAWEDHPVVLEVPERSGDVSLSQIVTIEIEPQDDLARAMPSAGDGDARITQHELAEVVAAIAQAERRASADVTQAAHSGAMTANAWEVNRTR